MDISPRAWIYTCPMKTCKLNQNLSLDTRTDTDMTILRQPFLNKITRLNSRRYEIIGQLNRHNFTTDSERYLPNGMRKTISGETESVKN
jgi:hypothetical protein